jgi:hypothetical protein
MNLTDRIPLVGTDEEMRPFLERASAWATALEYADVPRQVRDAAKSQLASTVGAAVWTTTHPLGPKITEATDTSDRDATFLGGGTATPTCRWRWISTIPSSEATPATVASSCR